MPAKTTTDPLAGIPVATAKPAKVAKTAPSGSVINLASAKKKRRLTGDDYQNAKKFAASMVGYDSTSPIWGKRLPVILAEVLERVEDAQVNIVGDPSAAQDELIVVKTLVQELQKRIAFGQVMKAQS